MLWFKFILGFNFIFLLLLVVVMYDDDDELETTEQWKIKLKPRITLNHNIDKSLKERQTGRVPYLQHWKVYLQLVFFTQIPGYLIECSVIEPNRTPIVRLGSVIEHNRTHSKIWSIEHNGTFDYRTPAWTYFCLFHLIKVDYDFSCVFYLFSDVKRWIPNKIEWNWVRLRSIVRLVR